MQDSKAFSEDHAMDATPAGSAEANDIPAAASAFPSAAAAAVAAAPSGPPSPSLDFLSPAFDPLRALHTPDLQPPLPSIRPLDYVAQFRKLLPPELAGDSEQRRANEESRKKHLRFKESALRARERIRSSATFSLETVHAAAAAASPGPLDTLRRWHAAGTPVCVTTRHANGVRGCATGVLAAYDRFMNVVLRNVTENYTVPVRWIKEYVKLVPVAGAGAGAGAGAAPQHVTTAAGGVAGSMSEAPGVAAAVPAMVEVTRTRLVRRREVRQRQLGQVFIKGDNVVSVYAAAADGEGVQTQEQTAGAAGEVAATGAQGPGARAGGLTSSQMAAGAPRRPSAALPAAGIGQAKESVDAVAATASRPTLTEGCSYSVDAVADKVAPRPRRPVPAVPAGEAAAGVTAQRGRHSGGGQPTGTGFAGAGALGLGPGRPSGGERGSRGLTPGQPIPGSAQGPAVVGRNGDGGVQGAIREGPSWPARVPGGGGLQSEHHRSGTEAGGLRGPAALRWGSSGPQWDSGAGRGHQAWPAGLGQGQPAAQGPGLGPGQPAAQDPGLGPSGWAAGGASAAGPQHWPAWPQQQEAQGQGQAQQQAWQPLAWQQQAWQQSVWQQQAWQQGSGQEGQGGPQAWATEQGQGQGERGFWR